MASVPLKQLQVGSKLNTPVYGVVTAFQCPKIDCNGNYYSTITIKDPSLEKEDGICCFFFQKSEENLPKIKTVGDVVRLKGLYVTMFKRCRQLKARPNCSWVVAHPDGAIDLFSYKADKSDMEKLKQLSDWGDKLEQVKAARRITLLSDIEPDNKYVNVLVELFSADHNKVDKNSYVLRVWDGTVPKCNSFFYGLQEGFYPEKTQTRDIPKYIEKRLMYIILYGGHIQKGLEANPGNVLRITNLNQRPLPQDTLDDLLSNESIPKKLQHSTKPWVCCALSEKNSYGRGLEIIDENGLEALKLKEKLAVVSETAEDSDESSIESGDGNVDVQDENEQLAMQQFRDEWRIHRESSASSFVSPWHLDEAEEPQAARILPRADNFEPVLDIQSADANRPVTEIQSTQRSRTNAEQHSQPSSSRRSLLDDMQLAREWTRLSDIKPDGKCINILVQVVSVHLSVSDSSCLILRVWDGTQPNCQSFSYGRTKDFKHVNDVPRHVEKRSISVSLHGNHVANGLEAVPGDFVKIRQMRQCGISNEDLEVSLARGFVPEKRKRSPWVFCVLDEGSSHGRGLEIIDKGERDALKLKIQLADVCDIGEESDEERDRDSSEEIEEGRVDGNREELNEGTEDDTGDDAISESLLSPVLLNTQDWDISFNESFENQMVINEPQAARILPPADNFEPVLDIQSADANRPVTEIQNTQSLNRTEEQANVDGKYLGSPVREYSLQSTVMPQKENHTPRRKQRQLENEERHRSSVGKYSLRSRATPRKENHTPARKQRQLEDEERHRSPLGKYSLQATATPRKENYTPRRKKRQLEDEERHSMSVGKYSLRSTFTPRKENNTPRRKKRQLENEERHKSPVGNSSLQATATPRKENYTPRRKKKQLENEERHKSPLRKYSLQATATPRKKNGTPRKKQRQSENGEIYNYQIRSKTNSRRYYLRRRKEELAR